MKRLFILPTVSAVLFMISLSSAQTPDANQEQRLLALIKEVQTQQAQMAENQAKIDEKINELSDTIREARLFSKRSK